MIREWITFTRPLLGANAAYASVYDLSFLLVVSVVILLSV